jgi:cytochrome c-type biogenesis protein CcmE
MSAAAGWHRGPRAYMVGRDPQTLCRQALCRRGPIGMDGSPRLARKDERQDMTRKQRRLGLIVACMGILGIAVGLVLFALRGSIVFFNSPTDLVEKHVAPGTRVRLGGLVVAGSIVKGQNLTVHFQVTDGNKAVNVDYQGILPDLFKEGQGVVTEGVLDPGGTFRADTVLAKHDERYMPREVAEALKKEGHWKDDYANKTGAATRTP